MQKTKLIVMGMGFYGRGWAKVAAGHPEAELVAVVDRSEEAMALLEVPAAKYTDLDKAVSEQKPDAVVLVVPPRLHIPLAKKLTDAGIAVLCEKPICEDLEEAAGFMKELEGKDTVCGIGENFRYRPVMREAKRRIENGAVGKIVSVSCRYVSCHPDASNAYHGNLKHPLLCDVTVHHLDVARFLMGAEPKNVRCTEQAAYHTWYQHRPAAAELYSEMENGSVFTYSGTLAAPVSVTDGFGDWEIIGECGVMRISGTKLSLYAPEKETETLVIPDSEDTRKPLLDGFIRALQENVPCESDIRDNYRSFNWMQQAARAAETGCVIEL